MSSKSTTRASLSIHLSVIWLTSTSWLRSIEFKFKKSESDSELSHTMHYFLFFFVFCPIWFANFWKILYFNHYTLLFFEIEDRKYPSLEEKLQTQHDFLCEKTLFTPFILKKLSWNGFHLPSSSACPMFFLSYPYRFWF